LVPSIVGLVNVPEYRTFWRLQRSTKVEATQAGTNNLCLRPLQQTGKSEPMLFWIAAIGSTWGVYALGFEGLIDAPDRAETRHGGRQSRTAHEKGRTTD
jgi:hypothetical protein